VYQGASHALGQLPFRPISPFSLRGKRIKFLSFYYGVDFYPEHWSPDLWSGYASLMQQAGMNVVRLAEFAWAMMEPTEGEFEFQWLDDAIAILYQHGIDVVLGTPTAAMPAWLKEKYPLALSSVDGKHRDAWGVRKNNCFCSADFRRLSKGITQAMAEHFAKTSGVIGWQTDNEFDGPECKCSICVREFATYLENKYTSLNSLNAAWGTAFWGQVYTGWSQIQAPSNIQHDNPSLCLDWSRFQTYVQVRFQTDQVAIIRQAAPKHFITHNYMGTANHSNCYELAADLDFASFDSYPGFPLWNSNDSQFPTGLGCDLTRGLKRKNFWIMETTAGPTGWGEFSRLPRPGELRKMFFHHVARGADGQLFFRWRTCTSGREQYWHGLQGHDGKAGRRYSEAKRIGEDVAKMAPSLAGTTVRADVAIVFDYVSRWATEIQPSFRGNDYLAHVRRYYDAFMRAGINVDVIPPDAQFLSYKAVVAPQLYVMPDDVALRLNEFVDKGGVLLADLRTGVKDETSLCHRRTLPGLLSDSLAINIPEYESLPGEYKLVGTGPLEGKYTAIHFADWIVTEGAEPLAVYDQWYTAGYAAVTRNAHGKGFGYYVGTIVDGTIFYDKLIGAVLADARIEAPFFAPDGVEISVRQSDDRSLIFVINHNEQATTITLPKPMHDVLTGAQFSGEIPMERYGVFVFESAV
jgi:beta-galactosidase